MSLKLNSLGNSVGKTPHPRIRGLGRPPDPPDRPAGRLDLGQVAEVDDVRPGGEVGGDVDRLVALGPGLLTHLENLTEVA